MSTGHQGGRQPSDAKCVGDQEPTPGSYIFIGPTRSGKTVLFVTLLDRLQRLANEGGAPYAVRAATIDAKNFVQDSMQKMQVSEWPHKTVTGGVYEFWITRDFGLFRSERSLSLVDCPGETFVTALVPREKLDDVHKAYVADAAKLRDAIRTARGAFLVIDAEAMYNHGLDENLSDALFHLSNTLNGEDDLDQLGGVEETEKTARKSATRKRVAVVFTKRDLFELQPAFDPRAQFKRDYPDAWANFHRLQVRYFFISAVCTSIGEHGKRVPPRDYTTDESLDLLEPAFWMLGLAEKSFLSRVVDEVPAIAGGLYRWVCGCFGPQRRKSEGDTLCDEVHAQH